MSAHSDSTPSPQKINYFSHYQWLLGLQFRQSNNCLIFRRDFVTSCGLTKLEALLLCDLIEYASNENDVQDDEGYILCTTEDLQLSLGWDRNIQNRLLKKLNSLRFLHSKRKGIPGRRWIRIEIHTIENELNIHRGE